MAPVLVDERKEWLCIVLVQQTKLDLLVHSQRFKVEAHQRPRLFFQLPELKARAELSRPINSLDSFLEVRFLCAVNVEKLSGVDVNEWKPGALNLYHDLVAFLEAMKSIRQLEFDLRDLVWLHRLGFLETIPELAAHDIADNLHLKSAHVNAARVRTRVGDVAGEHIDELYSPIAVGS